jgi:hypothetical protein
MPQPYGISKKKLLHKFVLENVLMHEFCKSLRFQLSKSDFMAITDRIVKLLLHCIKF